jgi:uracil-DNA glycosylase family 4
MKLDRLSPGGMRTCPNVGPLDADIVCVAESPADNEIDKQIPLVGRAGVIYNKVLLKAGIDRARVRIVNLVPAKAPGNSFARHCTADLEWGLALLEQEVASWEKPKVLMLMGNHPMRWFLGFGEVMKWRGSLFPPASMRTDDRFNEYYYDELDLHKPRVLVPYDVAFIPTFHPAAVARQYPWRVWSLIDFKKARGFVAGEYKKPYGREWFVGERADLQRVRDIAIKQEHMVGVDSELDPFLVSLVTEEEVHVFEYNSARHYRLLKEIMQSPNVLKVAHNIAHDWRFFEKVFDIEVKPPWFDTMGGAHVLEQEADKSLSPHCSSKFTSWPYHKDLVHTDPFHYCGLDGVVSYDSYWGEIEELIAQGLGEVVAYDHRLMRVLLAMQRNGLKVDDVARLEVVAELEEKAKGLRGRFEELAKPLVERAYDRGLLKKAHLFKRVRKCRCCRGAKKKLVRCWSCAGFDSAPSKADLLAKVRSRFGVDHPGREKFEQMNKVELEASVLSTCEVCGGEGEAEEWLEINPGSDDQVKDVLYRTGLGFRARLFQGKETTRRDQLESFFEKQIKNKQGLGRREQYLAALLDCYIKWSEAKSELVTVKRLEPDSDGRVRSVFDPWTSRTGRVASKEGLLDSGTNLMNIPKEGRKFIVAEDGCLFMYPDQEQIEARCVAVLSGDSVFKSIFEEGKDSHSEVAELIAQEGLDISRDKAKRTTYAVMYGIEDEHLATVLGCEVALAAKIRAAFLKVFRGIQRWQNKAEREVERTAALLSPTGRRRRWLGYIADKKTKKLQKKIRKEAWATQPQEMAARVLGEGLIDLLEYEWIRPLAHVHDAALMEVAEERIVEGIEVAESVLSREKWGMRFPTGMCVGPNWYVASIDDSDKEEMGFGEWTRERVIERYG